MRRRWRNGLVGVALCALLTGLVFTGHRLFPAQSVPAVSVTTIRGAFIDLAQWRGQPVIVTFWATSCPTCLKEIPEWRALYQEFHPRGLEMIAIAVAGDVPSHVVALTETYALPYPVALDPQDRHAQAFGGVAVTPTTFVIAPAGTIEQRIIGPVAFEVLRRRIATWLNG